jgi:uncharacterized protein
MRVEAAPTTSAVPPGFEGLTIIDCDVHNDTAGRLAPYLPERWVAYLELVGSRAVSTESPLRQPSRPMASRLDSVTPAGGPPGSDPEFAREQLLDEYGISAAVINNIHLGAGNVPLDLEVELARALNEYNQEVWLEDDPRWLSSIKVAAADPAAAALEIVRCRERSEQFVQVILDTHTERPAGNRFYWPIYEAAAELDIPVAFHVTARAKTRLGTGVGPTTFYFENRTSIPSMGQPLVTSLVFEGVFDRWPRLKVGLIELGWTWAVPLVWRLDAAWRVLRDETPHLQRAPSEYLRDNFWFSTQPGVAPERPEQFYEVYAQFERAGFEDRLMFSSDYPHWDMDSPFEGTPPRLPRETKRRVLGANAAAFYGLEIGTT